MKNKLIILLSLVTVLGLTSCKKPAQSTVQSGNFEVEFLFEKDGCKVYRFLDGGTYIYYTTCNGNAHYEQVRTSGKTSYTVRVQNSTSSTTTKP